MVYAGNPDLSAEAQERVTTAFRQVVAKLQANQRQEALIGLEFVLRLDPSFRPAQNLQDQLSSGAAEIDISAVVDQLQGPSAEEISLLLVDAVEDFNQRRFLEAKQKTEKVLADLPGHDEARQLLRQLEEALKVEAQVGDFLSRAREALDQDDPQEAANFVLMAQALDPHNPGIGSTLEEIHSVDASVTTTPPQPEPAVADDGAEFDAGPDDMEFAATPADAPAPVSFDDVADAPDLAFDEGPGELDVGGGGFGDGDTGATPEMEPPQIADGEDDWGTGQESGGVNAFSFAQEEASTESDTDETADIADLFNADAPVDEPEGSVPEAPPEEDDRVRQLLDQGQEAFDRGDNQGAIDIWSRIYLIDSSHEETGRRVDLARQRKDEIDRRVENLLYEAQDAADSGDKDTALERLEQILEETPNHLVALELKEHLTSPTDSVVAAPTIPELPDIEDDLFEDAESAEPASQDTIQPAPAVEDFNLVIPDEAPPAPPVAAPRRGGLPWRPLVIGAVGLLVILLGVWFGSQLLSPEAGEEEHQALERVLGQAEELFQAGRVEEAIHLLQEFPASGLVQSRVARRLSRYQQALAPPTPTPVPEELTAAEEAFAAGRWLQAYKLAVAGLESRPHDTGLLELKGRIVDREPLVAALHRALQNEEYATAASIAEDLVAQYSQDPDFRTELERNLFNAGLSELRTHNMAGAEVFLGNLVRLRPDDEEVRRILEFISEYKTRPVDMQLRVFIGSLTSR